MKGRDENKHIMRTKHKMTEIAQGCQNEFARKTIAAVKRRSRNMISRPLHHHAVSAGKHKGNGAENDGYYAGRTSQQIILHKQINNFHQAYAADIHSWAENE